VNHKKEKEKEKEEKRKEKTQRSRMFFLTISSSFLSFLTLKFLNSIDPLFLLLLELFFKIFFSVCLVPQKSSNCGMPAPLATLNLWCNLPMTQLSMSTGLAQRKATLPFIVPVALGMSDFNTALLSVSPSSMFVTAGHAVKRNGTN